MRITTTDTALPAARPRPRLRLPERAAPACSAAPCPAAPGGSAPPVPSEQLLQGRKAIEISHNGSVYRLQATRLGKLILTK